jgi:hypothetical protein
MTYLTLSADYLEFSLRDEGANPVLPSELGLPDELVAELNDWNSRYQIIIPVDMTERQTDEMSSLIRELDESGRQLADHIARVAPVRSKVRYYSEGWLRYLP